MTDDSQIPAASDVELDTIEDIADWAMACSKQRHRTHANRIIYRSVANCLNQAADWLRLIRDLR